MTDEGKAAERVIVESPYAGNAAEVAFNTRYLREALRDCLLRGESPFASHGLYTLPGVLDDNDPDQRKLGIATGFAWRKAADRTVVYDDLGITKGMREGIDHATALGHPVEYRSLPGWSRSGQELEFQRDYWQAKVGALLRLLESLARDPAQYDPAEWRDRAYALVNTDRSGRMTAERAVDVWEVTEPADE